MAPAAMTSTWTYNPQPPRPVWGVRAHPWKGPAMHHGIRTLALPSQVVLVLRQGAGGTATALVRAGERVLTGQPVGRHDCGTLVPATVTGTVVAVEERAVPAAAPAVAPCIVLRRDGDDEWHCDCQPADPALLSPADICRRVAAGGIVGLGGALFPTATKLAPGTPIRALVVNGAECEPWISCDEMLIRERAATVVDGAHIMMRALATAHAVIAVESDMPEARVALDQALHDAGIPGMGLAVVTAKYPAGGERQLIELLTGEEVPAGGLPRDIGYVCHNVGTAAAVSVLFRAGHPLISRIVTVTGAGIADPGNFEVRIGTSIRELIEAAGGYVDAPARLIMGGPMMGYGLPDDELPVTRATNCVVAATADEVAPVRAEMPCIRCGDCVEVCPARLMPHELLGALHRDETLRLDELGLADCIECGCCDYVCPSHIRLTERFVAARHALRERAEIVR